MMVDTKIVDKLDKALIQWKDFNFFLVKIQIVSKVNKSVPPKIASALRLHYSVNAKTKVDGGLSSIAL